jgi:cytochrome c
LRVTVSFGAAAGVFVAACAFALVHPYGNPRSAQAEPAGTLLQAARMPEQAKAILRNKCADCHSEATRWPLYSRAAPLSWLIEHDVADGRKHMDLSLWQTLTSDRQQVLLQEIVRQARWGSMPPIQYRLVHWGSTLTPTDRSVLAALVANEPAGTAAVAAGDATRGKSVFERKCTGCHAIDGDREGPLLRGVYGRPAGTVPGFGYSKALKNSGFVWDEDRLERWLRDTDADVPESAMGFSVPKAQDRADLIAFLKTLR